MYTFAKPRAARARSPTLMPKPVTLFDPVVRLRADMSREDISEYYIPPHFTNIQHALQLARQFLAAQDTPNRQIILITDGLPTAHFEGPHAVPALSARPDGPKQATLREGLLCQREEITINIFLLPSWSQSSEDVQFAYRLAEIDQGPRLLHRRPRPGPLRRLGLSEPAPRDRFVDRRSLRLLCSRTGADRPTAR